MLISYIHNKLSKKKQDLLAFLKEGKYIHIDFTFKKIALVASREEICVSEGNMKERSII